MQRRQRCGSGNLFQRLSVYQCWLAEVFTAMHHPVADTEQFGIIRQQPGSGQGDEQRLQSLMVTGDRNRQ